MLLLWRKKGIEVFLDCWEACKFHVSETSCCIKILCTVGEMGEQMLMKMKQLSPRPWVKKHDGARDLSNTGHYLLPSHLGTGWDEGKERLCQGEGGQ